MEPDLTQYLHFGFQTNLNQACQLRKAIKFKNC